MLDAPPTLMLPAEPLETNRPDTILTLPERTGIVRLADACREAALSFVNASPRWTKRDLAQWLAGPYAHATSFAAHAFGDGTRDHRTSGVNVVTPIDPDTMRRVIDRAREAVLESLRSVTSSPDDGATMALSILSQDLIVQCEDEDGNLGWAPVSRRDIVLADRVLSLFVADYLVRPDEYESSLSVCSRCSVVSFDAFSRLRGLCGGHRSGVFRASLTTLPSPPSRSA
jgi:hypothetical protein